MTGQAEGFFVTEFLVYLALSAFIGLFMTRFLFTTTTQLRASTAQTERIAAIYSAIDALAFDLERAPQDIECWRELQSDVLSWQDNSSKIRWYIDDAKLKRSVKKYDTHTQSWNRSVTHVALQEVDCWVCIPERTSHTIQHITIKLTAHIPYSKKYSCQRTVQVKQEVRI